MKKLNQLVMGVLFALLCGVVNISPAFGQSESEWREIIEAVVNQTLGTAVGEMLPPGVGDIALALFESPAAVKGGLTFWLQSKMQELYLQEIWINLTGTRHFTTV